ncbi:MAG: outer membrane protein assembly factor BamD [Candidatus Manganitrophaceae bacterium]
MIYRTVVLALFLFLVGCAKSGEKSELLSLLGVDEKIVDRSDQEVGKIYDALTLLKRGEANFVKEDYAAAADEFERFLTLHPSHRMAPFAQYRLAMSHYHQMNTNDRDPAPMEKAIDDFSKVVTVYPESLYAVEARAKLAELAHRQAAHHFYVGQFYYKNGAYPAAIRRFQKALSVKDDRSLVEKTLYYMGLSYYYSGQRKESRETLQKLLEEHPEALFANRAKKFLAELNATFPIESEIGPTVPLPLSSH